MKKQTALLEVVMKVRMPHAVNRSMERDLEIERFVRVAGDGEQKAASWNLAPEKRSGVLKISLHCYLDAP